MKGKVRGNRNFVQVVVNFIVQGGNHSFHIGQDLETLSLIPVNIVPRLKTDPNVVFSGDFNTKGLEGFSKREK
jgi:hypothetical protein